MPLPTLTQPEIYLLDTDICSYIARNPGGPLGERLRSLSPEQVAVSAVTEGETWYGLEWREVGLRRRIAVQKFYESVRVLSWPSKAAPVFGDLRARLRRTNLNIGHYDVMIAAHAMAIGATLITNNTRHFSRIGPPLKLENWLEP
jgi:tRNA(fMet)-specific endonuclease VapC